MFNLSKIWAGCLLAATCCFSGTAVAHHSVPVNFDTSTTITLTGTIVSTKWINPHSQIGIEVTTDTGETEMWLIEMNAFNTIQRLSKQLDLNHEEFIIGDELTITGWLGRNAKAVYFRKALLASGKEVVWQSRLDPDLQQVETFD